MGSLLSEYQSAIEFAAANAMFALSTWVAMWSGILSFAAVSFGVAGGFTAAALDRDHDLPFVLLVLIAVVVGAASAWVLSFALLKLESHWMALATLGLILITRVAVLNLPTVTGGSTGMPVAQKINVWWLLTLLAIVSWTLMQLRLSRFGMAATAIREDAAVAAAAGIDVMSIRRATFVASGAIGGLGGVVLSNLLQYISPDTFYIHLAFVMIAAVVLGGTYHWAGAILGALVFTLLPELLRAYLAEGSEIVNGVVLLLVMIFMPRGLLDPRWLRARRERRGAEAVADA